MKISYKLILSFLLVAALASVSAFFTLQSYQEIDEAFEKLVDDPIQMVAALNGLKHAGLQIVSSTSEYGFIHVESLGDEDDLMLEEENQLIMSGQQSYTESLKKYEEVVRTQATDEVETMENIKAAGDKLVKTSSEIIELKKRNISGKEILKKRSEFEVDERTFLEIVNEALKHESREVIEEQTNVKANIAFATRRTLFVTTLTFLLAILSGIYTSYLIANRIKKLKDASEKVGRGDLETQIEIKTRDEIGGLARAFNKMVDDLKKSRSNLAIARNFTDKMLDSMVDFVVVTDMNLIISHVNKAALRINGYEEHELIGQSINMLMGDRPFTQKGIDVLREKGFIANLDKLNLNKDGTLTPISMSISVLKDEEGRELGIVSVGKDSSERKQAERALEESKEFLDSIIDAIADPIFVNDRQHRMVLVNNAFCLFGDRTKDEIIGKTSADLCHPEDARIFMELDEKVFDSGEETTNEEQFTDRHGNHRVMVTKKNIYENRQGEKFLVGVIRDVTELNQSEKQLRVFNQKLQQSNRELQDFAYVASHDLQEPLRKVQAFADRLSSKYADKLEGNGLDYLERMRNAASRMQTLIQDLLTFSRITTKAKPFAPVDLENVVREVLSDLEIKIEETGADIEFENLPIIDADPVQMRQLLQNLVGNALKFHCSDKTPIIKISGRLTKNHSNGNGNGTNEKFCQITVKDNGIGFDEKYLDKIFTVFQRLHGRTEYEGSGVGLAVCRKIVERHHGTITAQSNPDEGAAFIFTLPLKQLKTEAQ